MQDAKGSPTDRTDTTLTGDGNENGETAISADRQAFVTAGFLLLPAYSYSATDNAQERRDARDTRQDARQDGRKEKVDCRQADQKSNSECRQANRDNKQDARKEAREIKY